MSRSEMVRAWMSKSDRKTKGAAGSARLPENPAGVVDLSDAELDAGTGADGCVHVRTIHLSCWDPDCSFKAPTRPDYSGGGGTLKGG